MIGELALVPSRRTVRRLDVAVALVVAAFTTAGLAAGMGLANLAELHRQLLTAADALDTTADAIGLVGRAPFIGENANELAGTVRASAEQLRGNALVARGEVRALAVVVGATIVAIAVVPLVVFYLPVRLARRRELRSLRRALTRPVEPMLVAHLAHAAVHRLPYPELRRITANPWRDLTRGDHRRLAAAEPRRLGLAAPSAWALAGHGGSFNGSPPRR